MDVGTFLVADAQSAELVYQSKGPLHNPAPSAEATAELGVPHRLQGRMLRSRRLCRIDAAS